MKRVACYVRVSTDNQIENYSIEEQTERLKAYCKVKDWHIHKFYSDAGYSGGNMDRPACARRGHARYAAAGPGNAWIGQVRSQPQE